MKTKQLLKKKEYFGKVSVRDLGAEGSLKEEFNLLTFLQLKENECVAVMHEDARVNEVCRIEKHYVVNPLLENSYC
jgi:hypothetical protein